MTSPVPRPRQRATFACCQAPYAEGGHTCRVNPAAEKRTDAEAASGQSVAGRCESVSRGHLPRPGAAAEDALAAVLREAGHEVVSFKCWLGFLEIATIRGVQLSRDTVVREYGWGIHVSRGFRSDFALPLRMVLIEVEGGAHGVQRQRRHDIKRDQLAQAAGYRIVRVLPEQVRDGSALTVIRAALPPAPSPRAALGKEHPNA